MFFVVARLFCDATHLFRAHKNLKGYMKTHQFVGCLMGLLGIGLALVSLFLSPVGIVTLSAGIFMMWMGTLFIGSEA